MKPSTVADVREVAFSQHVGSGSLTVYPGSDVHGVPFAIARLFAISGVPAGGSRGRHAHRACSQLCVCLAGRVEIRVDDGVRMRSFVLDDPSRGLLIPPWLWNEVVFAGPDTVLIVFCDEPYDEHDYIRDRTAFIRGKGLPAEPHGA